MVLFNQQNFQSLRIILDCWQTFRDSYRMIFYTLPRLKVHKFSSTT